MKTPILNLSVLSLLCFVFGPPVVRAELVTTLIIPTQPVQAGASIVVDLATLNCGDTPQKTVNAATLAGTLTLAGHTWPVELRAAPEKETVVAPSGFVRQSYALTLPVGVSGPGTLRISRPGADALNGVIEVSAEASSPGDHAVASVDPRPEALRVAEADTVLGRTFGGRLNVHHPIYFVYGGGDQAAKFQFSFKYRVATFSDNRETGILSTLQFGYMQRSLWNLDGDSSPFYETSYMPEVFWEWYKLPQPKGEGYGSMLGLQSGLLHESNGRVGTDSRSLNSAFIRAVFTFGPNDGWNLKLVPEVWVYGSLDEAAGIEEYRGYTKLEGVFGKADSVALRFSLSPGKHFDRLTYELDLTMPVQVALFDLAAFFHVQYFNGYGETLRSYSQKSDALRAGFSLTR